MKLKDINFNLLHSRNVNGLSIFKDDKEVACGFIREVLRKVPHLKDCEVASTNYYFDIYVVRLK